MKQRLTIVFAVAIALVMGLRPALASARTQIPTAHQHGSTMHDRSPHMRSHEPQAHH